MEATTGPRAKILRFLSRERAKLRLPILTLRCEGCGDEFRAAYGVDRCEPCVRELREIAREVGK